MTRSLLIRRLAWVLSALAACACRRGDQNAGAFRPLEVGAPVPAYVTRTLDGHEVRVGGPEPPTVLNVWATWCTSCREEMAALDSLQHEFGPQGARVIAVSVDAGDGNRVRRFATANHLGMTVAHDPADHVTQQYRVMGVPSTLVIGRDGRLLWQCTGSVREQFAELREAVRAAL
jgi:cytochrome c biogenesis protein CcmG, thiol:disulfide interchange protein DsbE